MLYPLKFKPIYKEKIWGGKSIKELKNDTSISDKCGESWEISGVQDNLSIVDNGFLKDNNIQELCEIYMGELLGEKVFAKFGLEFPLLFKIIDAEEDLSIQVHPDNEYAKENHNAYGKYEAWYVLQAGEQGKILNGFSKDISFDEFDKLIDDKQITSVINHYNAKPGDVHEIPPGRIHALGKSCIIAEIQQTSDITYRVYDYDRDDNRELHIDLAKNVLDFNKTEKPIIKFERKPDTHNQIISNEYFTLNMIPLMNMINRDLHKKESFVIYYCINGKAEIIHENKNYSLNKSETILIPAEINEIKINPLQYSELLEIYIDI
jgi:mannose-6-phosphate isomerase